MRPRSGLSRSDFVLGSRAAVQPPPVEHPQHLQQRKSSQEFRSVRAVLVKKIASPVK
jgi:hypothetical protein